MEQQERSLLRPRTYRARYLVEEDSILEDAFLQVHEGRIVGRGSGWTPTTDVDPIDLGDVAIVPGMVKAHSHSFQRLIRNRTEHHETAHQEDSFWTWREKMYAAANRLTPSDVYDVARMVFLEMLFSGITTVGEFHYVHHDASGKPYDDPNELAHRVIRAARDTGIRICLLHVAYARAGYKQPAHPRQARFIDGGVEEYLARLQALASAYRNEPGVSVGMAPHSIRAVSKEWMTALSQSEEFDHMPVHIHACEQRREIEESLSEFGLPPILALEKHGLLSARTTLVHATHLTDAEHQSIARNNARVCACPTTERNLGDGFLPASALVGNQVPICLGSDSQQRVDMWEDRRLVEYHERLRTEERNVLVRATPTPIQSRATLHSADILWPMAHRHGGQALQLDVGSLSPGQCADFLTIDLRELCLFGTSSDDIRSDLVFSARPSAVRDVFVGGNEVIRDRSHRDTSDILERYRHVVHPG